MKSVYDIGGMPRLGFKTPSEVFMQSLNRVALRV